jgi:HEAT repeat protein
LEEVEKHRLAYIDGKEDAVAELVKIFQDQAQASDVRMQALKALKDSRHPMAIEAVQQTVGGSGLIDLELMIQAINMLKEFGDEHSNPYLTKGLMTTEDKIFETREAYMEAISSVGSQDAIETLLQLTEISKRQQNRMDSLLAISLGTMEDARVIPWLIDISRDENVDVGVRSLAIDVLGKKEGPEVVDYFIDILGDPRTNLKAKEFALHAMGDIEESQILNSILTAYNQGKSEYSKLLNHLLNAVADFKDPTLLQPLKEIVKSDEYPQSMRLRALQAVTDFNDESVLSEIISILESPNNYMFYPEILDMLVKMKKFDEYKNELRMAAFKAHTNGQLQSEIN